MIERSTYDVLEWLGDVGGLHDALSIIGYYIVYPFAAFNLNFLLLKRLFNRESFKDSGISQSVCQYFCANPQLRRLQMSARLSVHKELDLTRFIKG